jgi:hypothetical protein
MLIALARDDAIPDNAKIAAAARDASQMMRATDQMAKVCREHQFFRYVAGMTQSRGPLRDTISISLGVGRRGANQGFETVPASDSSR